MKITKSRPKYISFNSYSLLVHLAACEYHTQFPAYGHHTDGDGQLKDSPLVIFFILLIVIFTTVLDFSRLTIFCILR